MPWNSSINSILGLLFQIRYGKILFVADDKRSKCRRGGMADAADSKSVNGNIVRVQVPPPAGKNEQKVVLGIPRQLFSCALFMKIVTKTINIE